MSRVAKQPIIVPEGVKVSIVSSVIKVSGGKEELEHEIHPLVKVSQEGNCLLAEATNMTKRAKALAATTRMLIHNIILGVSQGFERRLQLVGIGYRAQMEGKKLSLNLGFSHPVEYEVPSGITIETPSQTEITIKGPDKQKVGQVAANIRAYRLPEPYKGKGVRYVGERIVMKEAKKS